MAPSSPAFRSPPASRSAARRSISSSSSSARPPSSSNPSSSPPSPSLSSPRKLPNSSYWSSMAASAPRSPAPPAEPVRAARRLGCRARRGRRAPQSPSPHHPPSPHTPGPPLARRSAALRRVERAMCAALGRTTPPPAPPPTSLLPPPTHTRTCASGLRPFFSRRRGFRAARSAKWRAPPQPERHPRAPRARPAERRPRRAVPREISPLSCGPGAKGLRFSAVNGTIWVYFLGSIYPKACTERAPPFFFFLVVASAGRCVPWPNLLGAASFKFRR